MKKERARMFRVILRRFAGTVRWLAPIVVFYLLPKCPLCFAAYVAVGTGIGLSLTTATYLRMFFATVCIASFLFMLAKWFNGRLKKALPG